MTEITDPTRGSSEPGRLWTLTNMSEATPDVLSPLCWSVWGDHLEVAARQAWADFGILPRREVRMPADVNERIGACFFGRQAMNVDQARVFMAAIPGTSAEEFEKQICGFVRPDAVPVPDSRRRLPFIAAKAPLVLTTQTRAIRRLHGTQFAWWRSDVFGGKASDPPLVSLTRAADRFEHSISVHIRTRFLLQGLQSQVMVLAEKSGQPELGSRCFSGFGGVEETAIAQALWDLSRGQGSLDGFLSRYGFHGPAEGNPISRSWREDRSLVESLVEGLARRPDHDSPRHREQAAGEARRQAEAELFGRLPSRARPGARPVLRMAATHARNLELGKAAFLMAIDGCRAAARRLGADLAERAALEDPEDIFYLTIPELVAGPPSNAREVVAFRRARRDEHQQLDVPVNFEGMPDPVRAGAVAGGSTVTGMAGGQGTV
ncbi:MAG: PEP-utilizing enzyme, partial [Acidimicrobiia bacterium]